MQLQKSLDEDAEQFKTVYS